MGKFHKILALFILLVSLAFSILVLSTFCFIPFVTETVKDCRESFPWTDNAFTVYCAVLSLCILTVLLTVLIFPGESDNLTLKKSRGTLKFSKQTIESAVQYSFADTSGIKFSKVRIKINKKPEKTKIYVKLSLNDSGKFVELTETVQAKIESSLQLSLGIAVKFINVKVVEFNPGNPEESVKNSRVM